MSCTRGGPGSHSRGGPPRALGPARPPVPGEPAAPRGPWGRWGGVEANPSPRRLLKPGCARLHRPSCPAQPASSCDADAADSRGASQLWPPCPARGHSPKLGLWGHSPSSQPRRRLTLLRRLRQVRDRNPTLRSPCSVFPKQARGWLLARALLLAAEPPQRPPSAGYGCQSTPRLAAAQNTPWAYFWG